MASVLLDKSFKNFKIGRLDEVTTCHITCSDIM